MKRQPRTREIAAALALRGRREMSDLLNAAPPYRMLTQSQRAPETLAVRPRALIKGDKARGAALLGGRFALAGEMLEVSRGAIRLGLHRSVQAVRRTPAPI